MRARRVIVGLVLSGLWPLAGHADPLDIPELGVRIRDVPQGTAKPGVIPRGDGYTAIIRIGTATLNIARVEEPVAAGSDVKDANYRTAQQAAFNENFGPKVSSKATTISGHSAWTNASAVRYPDGFVRWGYVTYVIADQHLYRFVVLAVGGTTQPADLTAAGKVMYAVTFVPVDRSGNSALASGLLKMPPAHVNGEVDWYGGSAKRHHFEGVVGLEFSINNRGGVGDVRDLYATTYSELNKNALDMLQTTTFEVGPNWEPNGYDKLRFRWEVQFVLGNSTSCPGASSPPRVPDAQVMQVCARWVR